MSGVLGGVHSFLETGGPVLWLIGFAAFLLAALTIERYWYIHRNYPGEMGQLVRGWCDRPERHSWSALRIREAMISDARVRLSRTLPVIRLLVALCPMLGLLGTVTGMMGVFDVIAILGTGNARAMASGISKATIPTMAGMMVAIPGLYFRVDLQREVRSRVGQLADRLTLD